MKSTTYSDRSKPDPYHLDLSNPDPYRVPDEQEREWARSYIANANVAKWKYLALRMNSLTDGTWFYLSMLRRLSRAERMMHNAFAKKRCRKRIPESLERTTPFLNRRFSWD